MVLQDYLIAEGSSDQFVAAAGLFPPSRYYFSQDGMQWSDLDTVNADVAARASLLTSQLTGDPSNLYLLPEKMQEVSTLGYPAVHYTIQTYNAAACCVTAS